ncbi:hypothetical protein BGZ46_010619 [Entomortierella lignicola]|nr:hypothetical protein BGZ46_010619 [Entomortierella lignicola]
MNFTSFWKARRHKYYGISNLVSYQNQILAQLEKMKDLATTINTKRQRVDFDEDADVEHDVNHSDAPPQNQALKIGDSTIFTPKRSVKQLKLGTPPFLAPSAANPSNLQNMQAITELTSSEIALNVVKARMERLQRRISIRQISDAISTLSNNSNTASNYHAISPMSPNGSYRLPDLEIYKLLIANVGPVTFSSVSLSTLPGVL